VEHSRASKRGANGHGHAAVGTRQQARKAANKRRPRRALGRCPKEGQKRPKRSGLSRYKPRSRVHLLALAPA
jgi:hypothetical protein